MNANQAESGAERELEILSNRMLDLDGLTEERNRRFREISLERTHNFVENMKNPNTKRKTVGDVNLLHSWMVEKLGDNRKVEFIPPADLDSILARFFLSIRKPDLTEYEPESLKSKQLSISRYLKEKKYRYDIMSDCQFNHSRQCIFSKKKKLKQEGLGNKRRKADPFTEIEIQQMYLSGVLGRENPEALLNSMWLNNTMHFGLRGRQEHQTLLWGDVELDRTSDGVEYLVFNERATKTRNGASGSSRMFAPKMFEQRGDPYCPVKLYKIYADSRPDAMNAPESPFYLGINKHRKPESCWYICSGMGKNTLGEIAKRMSQKAGLSGRFTNHSGRKTAVTTLVNENVPVNEIMQLTGHKNIKSINDYSCASMSKQQEMSNMMANASKPKAMCNSNMDNALRAIENYENSDTNAINFANAEFYPIEAIPPTELQDPIPRSELQDPIPPREFQDPMEVHVSNAPLPPALESNVNDQNTSMPLTASPGGTLSLQFAQNRFHPQSMFQGCTFHAAISITINSK